MAFLVKRKKVQGYTLVYVPKELLEESAKRIGVYISELLTPKSLPSPKKVVKWKEVFGDA